MLYKISSIERTCIKNTHIHTYVSTCCGVCVVCGYACSWLCSVSSIVGQSTVNVKHCAVACGMPWLALETLCCAYSMPALPLFHNLIVDD